MCAQNYRGGKKIFYKNSLLCPICVCRTRGKQAARRLLIVRKLRMRKDKWGAASINNLCLEANATKEQLSNQSIMTKEAKIIRRTSHKRVKKTEQFCKNRLITKPLFFHIVLQQLSEMQQLSKNHDILHYHGVLFFLKGKRNKTENTFSLKTMR